nr:hypothetical protein [Tanacetum cinerariifolium]
EQQKHAEKQLAYQCRCSFLEWSFILHLANNPLYDVDNVLPLSFHHVSDVKF